MLDKKYSVLLAEDNKTNQLIVKSLLQQAGIELLTAGDGKEAVEMYQRHQESVDLCLSAGSHAAGAGMAKKKAKGEPVSCGCGCSGCPSASLCHVPVGQENKRDASY